MTAIIESFVERETPPEEHDHAWRRLDRGQPRQAFPAYRCDICAEIWQIE